ncbi:MAG: acyltransferase [Lachnospiraceae bacterium]|nr:acyltransferase [Lachnospiraceae bacterium]
MRERTKRQAAPELLRILAMLAIIASHYATKGGFTYTDGSGLSAGRWFLQFFSLGGFGDDLFILISAYFLSEKRKSKPSKALRLAGVTLFYSLLFYLIFVLLLGGGTEYDRSWEKLLRILLPVPFGGYWFITDYIVLYLTAPYLNRMLDTLDEKTHRRLMLGGICMFSLTPSVLRADFGAAGSWLPWFVVLYLTGTYIRRYADEGQGPLAELSGNRIKLLLLFTGTLLLRGLLIAIIDQVSPRVGFFVPYESKLSEIDQFLFFLPAAALFLLLRRAGIGGTALLYETAASVLGVYLIHNNEYLKNVLWHDIFRAQNLQDSPWLPLHMAVSVIAVFVVCAALESLRRLVFRGIGSVLSPAPKSGEGGSTRFDKK